MLCQNVTGTTQTRIVTVGEIKCYSDTDTPEPPNYGLVLPRKTVEVPVVNGISLKRVTFEFIPCSSMEMFSLISKCISPVYLTLCLSNDDCNDISQENIEVPDLTSLKRLKIVTDECYSCASANSLLQMYYNCRQIWNSSNIQSHQK